MRNPYRHPNYKTHFDQQQGQTELRGIMISEQKYHTINKLNRKQEVPFNKTIKKQL